ncbi:beta-1,4-galactosyltransferase galt-1-like isoform X3 [Cygnus olor]|nr:beta-1,4-galactosyltransferase galt-1-like isoform X3 [Cygnus olor]
MLQTVPAIRLKMQQHKLQGQRNLHLHLDTFKMFCGGKKSYFAATVCIITLTSMVAFSYLRLQRLAHLPKIIQEGRRCRGEITNNTITPLKDKRTFIISPYFDDRESKVTRVIGIVHHEDVKELYCWFCCQPHGQIYVSKAKIDVHSDRFGFPYGAADIVCLEPENCDPTHVSIHQSPHGNIDQLPRFDIKNRKAETFSVDFTLCISAMFGNYNNVLQFIQSMEMYKILGVQKVVVYKNSCSELMEKVLKFYMEEGTVEIIPWPINSYLKVSSKWYFMQDGTHIGYYGQITALNDCIYRNMQRSKFVVLNDADEIILPLKHPDWKTMMSSLQEQNPGTGIFLFENHIFPETVSTPVFNISSWNTVPGVNILQHVHREPDRKEVINPKKMIIDPRRVIQTSVHSVLRAYGTSVNVPMDVALIYHCRVPLQENLPRESLIRDTTLWKYNSSLITNVNKVLHQTVL